MNGQSVSERPGIPLAPVAEGTMASKVLEAFLERAAAYLPLFKLRVVALLGLSGVTAALMAPGSPGSVSLTRLAVFTLFAGMAAAGAACLNHLFEEDIDALMARTRCRPIPSGRVSVAGAKRMAVILLVSSLGGSYLALGPAVTLFLFLGAFMYAGIYTCWLKRRTSMNIVIGGLAGSCMVLAGSMTSASIIDPGIMLFALLVFLWTPPHFWSLAVSLDEDYRAAGIPMLPQVKGVLPTARSMVAYAAAGWLTSFGLYLAVPLGPIYLSAAVILGAIHLGGYLYFWSSPSVNLARILFKGSGLYLLLVMISILIELALRA